MDKNERLIRLDELDVILARIADPGAIACIQARRCELEGAEGLTDQFHRAVLDICEAVKRDYQYTDEAFLKLVETEGGGLPRSRSSPCGAAAGCLRACASVGGWI